ncbi:MAG: WcbI family polysaccharide biosynthesis putative acetyltransferase [Nocardioidaceae bacterium]|nr:WcbI family polysaccharide biosynthesis putative acetyltransferase [Nocardioidaceae bacterium]
MSAGPEDDLPLLVVLGNCQAESLRLMLAGDDLRTVRVPPVFELAPADVGPLAELLARTDYLVAQPVGADYRGLPIGTDQLAAHLPPSARTALVPSVRYAGLHPYHLLVHPPGLEKPDPPVVPYHDVRTVLAAAGRPALPPLTADAVLAVAAASVAELDRRERRHGLVPVSDLLARPVADTMRTINHPGNTVLEPLAARLRTALGLPARPPGVRRPLLDNLHAPLLPEVLAAHGLDVSPTTAWTVDGTTVTTEAVTDAHLAWYADRPDLLAAALDRALPIAALLG